MRGPHGSQCITALFIAASLWSAGCAFHGAANSPCRERCRYDYQFCNEEAPANSAHLTFSFAPHSEDSKNLLDPTIDHCARKFDSCTARCMTLEQK